MTLRDLINPHIRELRPYEPGKPVEELERDLGIQDSVKLASNEHPVGPSPRVKAAIAAAAGEVHRYPDGASFELRARVAERLGVEPTQLVFSCGGDELLELVAKTLLGPGTSVVYPWPSFAMYPLVVQGMGAQGIPVGLDADFGHDFPAMAAAILPTTKMVLLCNPNNPTGTSFGAADFDRFMLSLPTDVIVLVDEAYGEFASREDFPDTLEWVRRRPGTIVLRTFSKAYGLAGLRVGYGVTDVEFAGYLERARHPFNVNRLAEVAALEALDDAEYLEATIRDNRIGREALTRELRAMGFEVWPSDANFVLARTGAGVYEPLLREGVIVRPLGGFGLDDCVRITVGTAEANERVIKALRRIREEGA